MPSFLRSNQGPGTLTVHNPEPDELSRPTEAQKLAASELLPPEGTKRPRGWPKGKKRPGTGRKTAVAVMGIASSILDSQDPRWAKMVRQAATYRKTRVREMATVHGYVSAGVSALLAAASLALASSRFLYETAGNVEPMEMGDRLKKASQLADSGRQNELAAWELCSREGIQRRKVTAADQGVPWIKSIEQPSNAGRPSKREIAEKEGTLLGGTRAEVRQETKEAKDTAELIVSTQSLVPWEKQQG